MKRAAGDGEMRSRYDFSGGVRGKYAERYKQGVKVVVTESKRKSAEPQAIARAVKRLRARTGGAASGT